MTTWTSCVPASVHSILTRRSETTTLEIPTAGEIKIVWYADTASTKGKPVVVAQGIANVRRPGKTTVRIALTKNGRRLFARTKTGVDLRIDTSFTPRGSKPTTTTETLPLRG